MPHRNAASYIESPEIIVDSSSPMSSSRQRRKPPFENSAVSDIDYGSAEVDTETPDPETEVTEGDSSFSDDASEADDSDSDPENNDPESISSEIIKEIEDGIYVCLVCTCEVDRDSKIWSCKSCYRVYDLDCIRDWALRGTSTTEHKSWRCPSCNIEHKKIPSQFTCWCGKVTNPRNDSLIPFSCGNLCNKKYPNCVHSCSSICHPGKHPECGALGPVMSCKCGKHQQQLPCLATPYRTGWQCQDPCDTTVCAMGHKCSIGSCHSGFCGQCRVDVEARCYCGKNHRKVKCSDLSPKACSDGESKFVGAYKCKDTTIQYYDCDKHFVELECQPIDNVKPHCKYAPDVVTTCYCGKTEATTTRESCSDPMPECDSICGKKMKCGCTCQMKCHAGPCECFNIISTPCDCGFNGFLVPCKALQDGFVPKCKRKCQASLSCRRHVHREYCCPYERVAINRGKEIRRLRKAGIRRNDEDSLLTMEPVHICLKPCNQLKSCGKHRCEATCHRGNCNVCLESSSEDLVCHCGKTVIPAPVRCGSKVDCHEQCVREKSCGHRQEIHECHDDSVSCPKCTKLVDKRCNCGEKVIKNVMCSLDKASCGRLCTHRKDCGHPCNRPCSADCVQGIHNRPATCDFLCRKVRQKCPHVCLQRCHYAKNIPCDGFICKEIVKMTCECGRIVKEVPCGASLAESSKIGQTIECDADCAQTKREQELSEIFNVASKANESAYPEVVLSTYKKQVKWCKKMETIVSDFVSDYKDLVAAGSPAKKSLHFPPMNKPQRAFMHGLAEAYRLYSESQDKEPMRSVFICITGITKPPAMSIERTLNRQEEVEYKKQSLAELTQAQIDELPFNGILIKDVFFGVREETVRDQALELAKSFEGLENPRVAWTQNSQFVFTADNFVQMSKEKEDQLYQLSKSFKYDFRERLIAFDCKMCLVDDDITEVLKVDNINVMTPPNLSDSQNNVSKNGFDVLQEAQD